ncbi:MAG: cytochrome c biogenesis heme-transporting ATPase CcmA [Gammaproteobacteria bacterium]|nr:cytochrome c biogenesis heme-transporting ATPase CcmA [Gammaproteobacteria bacterium]
MLEASGLECVRGQRRLFSGLSCKLAGGDLLHIRGANGSGKTSLLRLLCGLSLPEAGEVRWGGAPIGKNRADFHRALAYIGHRDALNGDLSALENLRAACALAGRAAPDLDARAALRRMGLGGCLHLPCRALSAGQRRRAAIAGLLLRPGGVWLLDEPAAALDDSALRQLDEILAAQAASGGMAVFTSHRELAAGRARQLRLADFT